MTYTEFAQVLQLLSGTIQPDAPGGLYAHWPLNAAAAAVWYKTLAPYPVTHVCAAIEAAYADDPRYLPAPQALIERLRAQAPAALPPPPWWSPELVAVVQQQGINSAFGHLRSQQHDSDWRACYLALVAAELHRPGQEAPYLARCRQYATQYPADRADWEAEIARVEQRLQAAGSPVPRSTPPPQVGSFTHVSAPRPAARRGRTTSPEDAL